MESLKFNLQLENFTTVDDEWENQNSFWCAFSDGYFREESSGNCKEWNCEWWHIGKVEKNKYNSYDLVKGVNKVYKTVDEALEALKQFA
jgi:hypothetical protein